MAIMIKILMMTRTVHRRRGCPVNRCNQRSWGTASPRWGLLLAHPHYSNLCCPHQLLELFQPYYKYCAEQTSCQQYCKEQDRDNQVAVNISIMHIKINITSAKFTITLTTAPPWPGVQSVPRLVWDSEGLQSVETRRHPGQTDAEAHQVQSLVEGTHIVIRIMMRMMMLSMVVWSLRFFDQMTI